MTTPSTVNGATFNLPQRGEDAWQSLTDFLKALPKALCGIVTFGNTATPNVAGTTYLRPAYRGATSDGFEVQLPVPAAGKVRGFSVNTFAAPAGASVTFTVRKNGVDTTVIAVLAAGQAQVSNFTATADVAAGDRLSIKVVTAAGITAGCGDTFATIAITAG